MTGYLIPKFYAKTREGVLCFSSFEVDNRAVLLTLAEPGGPWHPTFVLGRLDFLDFLVF